MKTYNSIQLTQYSVSGFDERIRKPFTDTIVLDKAMIHQGAAMNESSNETISRLYAKQGYRIVHIEKLNSKAVTLELDELFDR